MRTIPILLMTALALGGCMSMDRVARDAQNIPLTIDKAPHGEKLGEAGAIYLWPPYSSAAVVDGKGNRCILAASGAKTLDASSDFAFKLGKAFEQIDGLDVATKQRLLETFTKISAADAHAAFADVALFHLCILDQNGTFELNEQHKSRMVMDAYLAAVKAAAPPPPAPAQP